MNIKYIILGLFSLFLLSSCQTNRIKLLYNDYQIINYSDNKSDEKSLRKILKIKVINPEKITQISNATHPIIYIDYNNKTYFAVGNYYYKSAPPIFCDYFFYKDENGKICDFQNNSIKLMGSDKLK
jgi:hypothetical protein